MIISVVYLFVYLFSVDMEADISQLEAPTFTTISRGPPEPMLRLKWNHKVNLIGEKVLNPMIHICDQCDKPILHYGRMIPCKHVFCLKCARTEPIKVCPRCNDKVVRVEQSGLGTVFMCTHSGSRYGNTGCRRTYLSQRDLQAHINHRHVTQPPPPPPAPIPPSTELKTDLGGSQRKLSESASAAVTAIQAPSTLLAQRTPIRSNNAIGSINPPGPVPPTSVQMHSSLTQANLARINNANAQECHQGKVAIHQSLKKGNPAGGGHHQTSETVADASYYSSVLNSFGGSGGGGGGGPSSGSNTAYESQPGQSSQGVQGTWQQQQQYYR